MNDGKNVAHTSNTIQSKANRKKMKDLYDKERLLVGFGKNMLVKL